MRGVPPETVGRPSDAGRWSPGTGEVGLRRRAVRADFPGGRPPVSLRGGSE